jgi:hypothetical protein
VVRTRARTKKHRTDGGETGGCVRRGRQLAGFIQVVVPLANARKIDL